MKTTVKHLSDTRVLVTITLGATELEAAEQVALKKLAKNVKVDGFRKGHVPIALIKKNVDPNELGQETIENALSRAVRKAISKRTYRLLSVPKSKSRNSYLENHSNLQPKAMSCLK